MWKGTKEHDEELKVLRFWSEDEKRTERRHDASRSARLHAASDMKVRIARARWVLYLAAQQNTRGEMSSGLVGGRESSQSNTHDGWQLIKLFSRKDDFKAEKLNSDEWDQWC